MEYISACIHGSNEIPRDILMFLASNIITGLIRILFHVRVCGKFVVYISTSGHGPHSLIYHSP